MKKTHLDDAPRVVVFAGPNGAGKSTHADDILKAMGIPTFVNADYIARGLAGTNTEAVNMAAGRIMLRRLSELAAAREDFAFESTLSSRSFAPFLQRLKAAGYTASPSITSRSTAPNWPCAASSCASAWAATMCRPTSCAAVLPAARPTSLRFMPRWPMIGRCSTTHKPATPA